MKQLPKQLVWAPCGPPLQRTKPLQRATLPALVLPLVLVACAARHESATRRDLDVATRALAGDAREGQAPPPIDGTLGAYVSRALAASPELRADHARWRAATLRVAPARALPDPMVTYAFYASPVQTRVGPQRHRLSVQQRVPWPTRLTAAADAQSSRARAAQRRFEARALAVRERVADAWWRVWRVRRARARMREQRTIVEGLAETLRGRLEVSRATLAEVSQVDLTIARLDDAIDGLGPAERAAEAALREAAAIDHDVALPIADAPPPRLPALDEPTLRAAVLDHPFLATFALMAEAAESEAGAREAERLPSFAFGVDWIETGDAVTPVPGSGDDAVIVQVGVSIPLWQGAYDDAQRAAEADAVAARADGEAAERAAMARLTGALAAVRDHHRRARTHDATLLPQAIGVYEAVLAAYATGQASIAQALLAQRDLLELTLGALDARAEHGRAWARLEATVGRPVPAARDETDADPHSVTETDADSDTPHHGGAS